MVEPTTTAFVVARRPAAQGGFTLIEMLAALSILLVAVTTLLASLGGSIALRRSTDARLAVAAAIDDVVVLVQQTGVRRKQGGETDLDLELAVPDVIEPPGFPGVTCHVVAETAADRPDVWLLRIDASWMDQGDLLHEEFLRVVPRQLPLGARIQRFREENPR